MIVWYSYYYLKYFWELYVLNPSFHSLECVKKKIFLHKTTPESCKISQRREIIIPQMYLIVHAQLQKSRGHAHQNNNLHMNRHSINAGHEVTLAHYMNTWNWIKFLHSTWHLKSPQNKKYYFEWVYIFKCIKQFVNNDLCEKWIRET